MTANPQPRPLAPARMRTSADFLVDTSATPNGCTRCGELERGHAAAHDYVAPPDALRLARMKARREARLNPPVRQAFPPDLFITFTVDTGAFSAAMVRLACAMAAVGETMRPAAEGVRSAIRRTALDIELEAAKHWPAQGSTCAHVCGPDPGHRCDARATTTLRHPLPSGGICDLPLCGPCAAAESPAASPSSPAILGA